MNERQCEHHYCQCIRAEELARIADRTGRGRFIQEAIAAHSSKVRCRMTAEAAAEQDLRDFRRNNYRARS